MKPRCLTPSSTQNSPSNSINSSKSTTTSRSSSNGSGRNSLKNSRYNVHDDNFKLETSDVAADSMLSSLASRVFLQVLSARVQATQVDSDPALLVEGNSCNDDDDYYYYYDGYRGFNNNNNNNSENYKEDCAVSMGSISLAPSMSISSIARAEQMLQKSVPLVNGGRHVSLTREDMSRIRDGELLRFLETNSAMFVKYLQQRSVNAETAIAGSTLKTNSKENDIEREINELANDIETFITAFDNEGQEYHICLDSEGKLLVPVAPEESFNYDFDDDNNNNNDRENEDDMYLLNNSGSFRSMEKVQTEKKEEEIEKKETDTLVSTEREQDSVVISSASKIEKSRGRLGRRFRINSSSATPLTNLELVKQPQELKVKSKQTKKRRSVKNNKKNSTVTTRSMQLRGIGLTAEEDSRVAELLRVNFDTQPTPFTEMKEKLSDLDERLRSFQQIRGPLLSLSCNYTDDNELTTLDEDYGEEEAEIHDGDNNNNNIDAEKNDDATLIPQEEDKKKSKNKEIVKSMTAKSIGDAYMLEVQETRKRQSRLREINAKLSRLHHLWQLEELCPSAGASELAKVPLPKWAKDVPPPPSEELISQLLDAALRENNIADSLQENIVKVNAPRGDGELSFLQEKLQLARSRAEALLSPNSNV